MDYKYTVPPKWILCVDVYNRVLFCGEISNATCSTVCTVTEFDSESELNDYIYNNKDLVFIEV